MLAEQARCASQVFTGQSIPANRSKEAARAILSGKENRVLIGMPGCGKSTVGRELATLLNRPFVDCDKELEKILGVPAGDYITHCGEAAFRAKETALLERLGRESGLVISTGGGCVTRSENYPLLHQNGTMIFLERELSKLPKKGRPLSLRGNLEDMYTIRLPMYRRFADLIVANDSTPAAVAKTVEEAYEHFSD
jgi:shikimate dehydrogenase